MEGFVPQTMIKRLRTAFVGLCSPLLFLVSGLAVPGCVHLPKTESDDDMPHGAVCQAVATWNHQVVFAADPAHGGAEAPGLVGRLYLFGPEISYPLIDDGSVVVDLFDDTRPASEGQPIPLEEWRIDSATLKRLAKRDMIGWGYTLFLPWGTYKPDISQVHLKVRYITAKGNPFFAESGPLTLNSPPGTTYHTVTAADKSNGQSTSATAPSATVR